MCGRFTLRRTALELIEAFSVVNTIDHQPRFNIAPSQDSPVVRMVNNQRHFSSIRWGLIPFWAKEAKIGYRMINARSEQIAKSYQAALNSRRCLVVADGWYEWKNRQPYHFRMSNNELFAFAGIWECWNEIETFSIFTTHSTGRIAEYHDRMPVILPVDAYDVWLDTQVAGNDLIDPLLKPCEELLTVTPANPCVGNAHNESAECLEV